MRYTCFSLIRDRRGVGRRGERLHFRGKNFLLVLFFRAVFALDDGINSSARYLRNFSGDEISLGVPSRPVPVCSLVRKLASVTSICERPHGRGEREREKKGKKRGTKYKREGGNEKFFSPRATSTIHRARPEIGRVLCIPLNDIHRAASLETHDKFADSF